MSMAGLMTVLEQEMATGGAAPVHVSIYKLKADAPDDAVAMVSKNLIVPLMEKMLADGAIVEYEMDEQAIHTSAPGTFMLVYVTPPADGLDKVSAGLIMAAVKAEPLAGPAFESMTDYTGHRDELEKGNGVFK